MKYTVRETKSTIYWYKQIRAYKNDEEIGLLQFTEQESGTIMLESIDVKEKYQRRGIGTALYRKLEKKYGKNIDWGEMTKEGEALYKKIKG